MFMVGKCAREMLGEYECFSRSLTIFPTFHKCIITINVCRQVFLFLFLFLFLRYTANVFTAAEFFSRQRNSFLPIQYKILTNTNAYKKTDITQKRGKNRNSKAAHRPCFIVSQCTHIGQSNCLL